MGDFARYYDTRVRGLSSYFVWANRSKESLTLNLKHRDADDILARLLARADVLVQNLVPGATDRLGLSYQQLHAKYPQLIVCDISGYGGDGPYCEMKAYDLLIQSESGFLSVTGTRADPAKAGISIADISGGMYAYSGILTALIQRGKTGRGSHLDISMLECMVEWMSSPLYYAFDGAEPPARTGTSHATLYPYGPFRCSDGTVVMLGLQNEREWTAFCEIVLEKPALAKEPRFASSHKRGAFRAQLEGIVGEVFSRLPREEVMARLERAHIATANLNDMHAIWAHPQLKARGRWTEVDTPSGSIPALLPPGLPDGCEARIDPVPALGQHTDTILQELGIDPKEITRLRGEGAI